MFANPSRPVTIRPLYESPAGKAGTGDPAATLSVALNEGAAGVQELEDGLGMLTEMVATRSMLIDDEDLDGLPAKAVLLGRIDTHIDRLAADLQERGMAVMGKANHAAEEAFVDIWTARGERRLADVALMAQGKAVGDPEAASVAAGARALDAIQQYGARAIEVAGTARSLTTRS